MNEKIYLVIWLWMIVLAVWSGLAVLYRMACIIFPQMRTFMLTNYSSKWSIAANVCREGMVRKVLWLHFHKYRVLSMGIGFCWDSYLRMLIEKFSASFWNYWRKLILREDSACKGRDQSCLALKINKYCSRRHTVVDVQSIPFVGGWLKPGGLYPDPNLDKINKGFTKEKNDSGFETEETDCDSFTLVAPNVPSLTTEPPVMPSSLTAPPGFENNFTGESQSMENKQD